MAEIHGKVMHPPETDTYNSPTPKTTEIRGDKTVENKKSPEELYKEYRQMAKQKRADFEVLWPHVTAKQRQESSTLRDFQQKYGEDFGQVADAAFEDTKFQAPHWGAFQVYNRIAQMRYEAMTAIGFSESFALLEEAKKKKEEQQAQREHTQVESLNHRDKEESAERVENVREALHAVVEERDHPKLPVTILEQPPLEDFEDDISEEELAENISEYVNSEKFIEYLQGFDERVRRDLVGLALEYHILHPDGFHIDTFFAKVKDIPLRESELDKNQQIASLLADSVAEKFGFPDRHATAAKEEIYDYFYQQYYDNGYFYHGFNGAFAEQVAQQGLTAEQRMWDWEDLQRIQAIGKKNGKGMLLGWANINSQGNIFYSETPRDTYRYSIASPEWFAQFTSEGFHVSTGKANKEAFYRRDHETARANIEQLCDSMQANDEEDVRTMKAYPNITDDERQEVLDFFEKYWQKFAGEQSTPKAALIRKEAVTEFLPTQSFDEYCRNEKVTKEEFDVAKVIDFNRRMMAFGNDSRTKKTISPDDLVIVDLPDFNRVCPVDIKGKTAHEQSDISKNNFTYMGEHTEKPGDGFYRDEKTGEEVYVKFYEDIDHSRIEVLANTIYQKLGIPVPDSRVDNVNGRVAYISKVIEGHRRLKPTTLHHFPDIQNGFVADAFLSNWDVTGYQFDNIERGDDDKVYRVDNGGALTFHGLRDKKEYTQEVTEIDTMRDPRISPRAAMLYYDLTEEDIRNQAQQLVDTLSNNVIDDLIEESGLGTDMAEAIREGMKGRRAYLIKRFGLEN